MRFIEASRYYYKHFGIRTTNSLIWCPRLLGRIFKNHYSYIEALLKWQNNLIKDIIGVYVQLSSSRDELPKDYKIFTCWWQGLDSMPDVIRECYKSLLRNANGHEVLIITKDNFTQYVDVPELIMAKLNRGTISFSHFSDILRLSLLSKYGGLWVDSALYITKPLPHYTHFFMPRMKYLDRSISQGRWCFGVIAFPPHFNLVNFMKDCLNKYWQYNDAVIDYLMFDGFLRLGYENIRELRKIIDGLEISSPDLHSSRYTFNEEGDPIKFKQLVEDNNFLSLTWRVPYSKKTADGKPAYYGLLLDSDYNKCGL